jgi:RimJ/RimL family protein N-acetyltransferase
MEISGAENIQKDGLQLRPIAEADASLIMAASVSDVPDWTFIPRDLDEGGAREWIRRGFPARESGRAVRFVIEFQNQLAGTVGAQHPHDHDRGIVETFYFVLPEFRRRGLATAGLRLLNR